MKYGFPPENRLRKASEFRHVFQRPRKIDMPTMAAYGRTNHFDAPRLGVIVAKKQVKKASQRNQIKRVVRESFRLNQQNLHSLDIIVSIKRDSKALSNKQLRAELDKVWEKLTAISSKGVSSKEVSKTA